MYIEKEGNAWVVINESGHVIATRRSESDANKFIKAQKKSRGEQRNRREARVSYSSRDDD